MEKTPTYATWIRTAYSLHKGIYSDITQDVAARFDTSNYELG